MIIIFKKKWEKVVLANTFLLHKQNYTRHVYSWRKTRSICAYSLTPHIDAINVTLLVCYNCWTSKQYFDWLCCIKIVNYFISISLIIVQCWLKIAKIKCNNKAASRCHFCAWSTLIDLPFLYETNFYIKCIQIGFAKPNQYKCFNIYLIWL